MKKLLLVLLVFTSSFFYAQNAQDIIDGLKKEIRTNPDDKKRATIYSNLSFYYCTIALDSALYYSNKAIMESKKVDDPAVLGQIYSDAGAVYLNAKDLATSKNYYQQSYDLRKSINDENGMNKVAINLATIYKEEGDNQRALKLYLKACDYFEKSENVSMLTLAYSNIGVLFNKLKNYKKVFFYTNKAVKIQEENNRTDQLPASYVTLGIAYLNNKDTVTALKYYDKARKIAIQTGNNAALATILNNIAVIKVDQKKSDESIKIIDESKKVYKKFNPRLEYATVQLAESAVLINAGKYQKAKKILLDLKKQYLLDAEYPEKLIQTYSSLSIVYSYFQKQDSVIYYNNSLMELQDSYINNKTSKETAEIETKYQTAQKEKLILQQQTESKQKNIWLILISSIAIIGLLLFRQQRLKSRQQKEQARLENKLLQEQSNFKIQEQRLEISRELHDSVGSQLTFIISILDNMKNAPLKLENTFEKKIDNLSGYANNSISELRATIWALNTDNLTISELETRILNFVKEASESVETINFDFKNNCKTHFQLTSKQGINLFRVVQESVNNAVKHSKASQINIILDENENQLSMKIQDNGQGFDYEEKRKKSYGLTNLQKRISELNGTFDLISNDGGTSINITISTNE